MKYAIIENELVTNIILAEQDFINLYYPIAVNITTLVPQPGIGWTYVNEVFTEPEVPVDPTIHLNVAMSIVGGDGMSPVGILNDGVSAALVTLSVELPDGSPAPMPDGSYRVVVKDGSEGEYDVIMISFVDAKASFSYTSDMFPATVHIDVCDLSIEGVDTLFSIKGDNLIKIYRVVS